MSGCLSSHLPVPQSNPAPLTWIRPRSGERCRVIDWTCGCRSVVYELCSAGGQFFIRRTVQGANRTVAETSRGREGETRKLWTALLTGRAR
ncbi:hypothetical protein GCM10017673_58600 [Streptosporangium violaceochromogenes]|nr:hypothetical protein GCM10017673_58600 [Streptosporangium violaceochromogenes]